MYEENKPLKIAVVLFVLLAVFTVGYISGSVMSYYKGSSAGYQKAQDDAKKLQEAAAQKAAEDAAKAANPFQVANPLENVEANPFEKAKKILNPF